MSALQHDDRDGGSEDSGSEEEMSSRRCALANARGYKWAPCSRDKRREALTLAGGCDGGKDCVKASEAFVSRGRVPITLKGEVDEAEVEAEVKRVWVVISFEGFGAGEAARIELGVQFVKF